MRKNACTGLRKAGPQTACGGFTLIELMIVVIIIAALAGMVLPRIISRGDDAKSKIAQGEIFGISTALKLYFLDNGRYPSTQEGLDALMVKPSSAKNWKGPYLEKKPVDPWERKYEYRYPGSQNASGYDIWSQGPDETTPEDDVKNW